MDKDVKIKGNAVEPMETLESMEQIVRWYFHLIVLYLPSRYSDKAVTEGQRKFMVHSEHISLHLYTNIDKFDATKHSLDIDSLS